MSESVDFTEGNLKAMKILARLTILLQLICSILYAFSDVSMGTLASFLVFLTMIGSIVNTLTFNEVHSENQDSSLIWDLIWGVVFYGALATGMIFAPPNGVVFATIGCSFSIALSEALIILLGKSVGIPLFPCGKQQNSSIVHPQEDVISNDAPPAYSECVKDQELPGYYEIV